MLASKRRNRGIALFAVANNKVICLSSQSVVFGFEGWREWRLRINTFWIADRFANRLYGWERYGNEMRDRILQWRHSISLDYRAMDSIRTLVHSEGFNIFYFLQINFAMLRIHIKWVVGGILELPVHDSDFQRKIFVADRSNYRVQICHRLFRWSI